MANRSDSAKGHVAEISRENSAIIKELDLLTSKQINF